MSIDKLETYINRNGFPMIRRCQNCLFWKQGENDKLKIGECTIKPYYFAFTLEPNLYPLTKEFFLCENHKFNYENKLEQVCTKVSLKDSLKKKEDIK
jgi:hypothetical protein